MLLYAITTYTRSILYVDMCMCCKLLCTAGIVCRVSCLEDCGVCYISTNTPPEIYQHDLTHNNEVSYEHALYYSMCTILYLLTSYHIPLLPISTSAEIALVQSVMLNQTLNPNPPPPPLLPPPPPPPFSHTPPSRRLSPLKTSSNTRSTFKLSMAPYQSTTTSLSPTYQP